MAFLEERLPITMRIGLQYQEGFDVDATEDSASNRYAKLISPFPKYTFSVSYIKPRTELANQVLSLYRRVYGSYAGFRVYAHDDHSTAQDGISEPTALDCVLLPITNKIFQLQKEYGLAGAALPGVGRPKRRLKKPISGSVKIAVAGVVVASGFTVDYTTGLVTFAVAPVGVVTGGCQFDIPCAFATAFDVSAMENGRREVSMNLVELLNP